MLFHLADNLEFFEAKDLEELLFLRNTMRILDFSFLQFLRFLAQKFVKFFCPFSLEFALEDFLLEFVLLRFPNL